MPPPLPTPPPAAPALTAEHLAQLDVARVVSKKIRRAIRVAAFDGYAIAAFAGVTLLTGLTDPPSLLLGVAMGVVAFVEIRAAGQLRRLVPTAPRTLGFNQLALAGVLICYAVFRLVAARHAPSPYAEYTANDPEAAKLLGPIDDLTQQIMVAFYAILIAVAVLAQGGLAVYYFTRPKYLRAYLDETPGWILALQRQGVSL